MDDDKVLKVELRDEQARRVKSLRPGDYVAMRCIRLKANERNQVHGTMRGNEVLIEKLNPNGTGNEEFIELLKYADYHISGAADLIDVV